MLNKRKRPFSRSGYYIDVKFIKWFVIGINIAMIEYKS